LWAFAAASIAGAEAQEICYAPEERLLVDRQGRDRRTARHRGMLVRIVLDPRERQTSPG
jgi:hypothetical protein